MPSDVSQPGAMDAADLYRAYAPFVARYVYRLGVPAAQVDDVVQEVFLVVHKRGGYAPGPAKPTSYLAAIANHAAAHARRSLRRSEARRAEDPLDEQPSSDEEPDRGLSLRDDVELVRAALARLDPAQAATLLLADGEDEPCPSIAAAMGVPLGTVYFRLHSARLKFGATVHKLEAQRSHDERRARAAPPPLTGALARRGVMIGLFEVSRRKFEGTRAFALLRATRHADGGRFDAARGLARHLEHVAREGAGTGAPSAGGAHGGLGGRASVLGKWAGGLCSGGALAGLVALGYGLSWRERDAALRQPVRPVALIAPADEARVEGAIAPKPVPGAPLPAAPDPEPPREARPRRASRVRAARADAVLLPAPAGAPAVVASTVEVRAADPEPTSAPKASPPSPPPPAPTPARALDPLATLAQAERLASERPHDALALLARLDESAAARYLAEELAFVRLSAHYHAGHAAEVRTGGPAFLATHPTSAFASRVRAMIDAVGR